MAAPEQDEINRFHRWFAIECNNRSWDLASRADLDEAGRRELLLTAMASVYHWEQIGKPVNGMRGDALLAHVHSLLGRGEEALAYATRCLRFCLDEPTAADAGAWDVAFAHLEMAFAAGVAGDTEVHAAYYAQAAELAEGLDADDRKVFDEEFARIPVPGSE